MNCSCNSNNLFNRVIIYFFLFPLICFSIILAYPYIINSKPFNPSVCRTNLSEINAYLDIYFNQKSTYISYEDIEGSEYNNWGRFVMANQVRSPDTERRLMSELLTCPYSRNYENVSSGANDYWWADLSNEDCFPKHQLGPSLDKKTPIAGDAPGNHGKEPPVVLLKSGAVKRIEVGSKLWKRAYGMGGCLRPPKSNMTGSENGD